ncbi:MAG: hypothetical protein ACI30I_10440 [Parabacteroides sp.]
MAKGLDGKFLHYGIRQEDLELIRILCQKHELDYTWVSEAILKRYHTAKVEQIEVGSEEIERILSEAITGIKG